MNNLLRLVRPVDQGKIVLDQIKRCIEPFNPGEVHIRVMNNDHPINQVIIVTASTFKDLYIKIDGSIYYDMTDEVEIANFVGLQAGQYLNSLRNEPVPDNIDLGCN